MNCRSIWDASFFFSSMCVSQRNLFASVANMTSCLFMMSTKFLWGMT
jgi:hypothetical protein